MFVMDTLREFVTRGIARAIEIERERPSYAVKQWCGGSGRSCDSICTVSEIVEDRVSEIEQAGRQAQASKECKARSLLAATANISADKCECASSGSAQA